MRGAQLTLAALLLAGCDEPKVITHLEKLSHMRLNDLWTMQDTRGLPVEIYGAPFADVGPRAIADAMRPPAGSAQEVRFHAVPPGAWRGGTAMRIVLHVNALGAPNAQADCRLLSGADAPSPAGPLHRDGELLPGPCLAGARLPPGPRVDMPAFSEMMREQMLAIFHEEKDR